MVSAQEFFITPQSSYSNNYGIQSANQRLESHVKLTCILFKTLVKYECSMEDESLSFQLLTLHRTKAVEMSIIQGREKAAHSIS